jgi:RecB family endonuclease NucS
LYWYKNSGAEKRRTFEADILGYSEEKVYMVEVKSILKNDHIGEMLENLKRFPKFFPEHKDKALYGIMAAVDIAEHLKKKVIKEGIYMAIIREDTFCIEVPEGFKPKRFD